MSRVFGSLLFKNKAALILSDTAVIVLSAALAVFLRLGPGLGARYASGQAPYLIILIFNYILCFYIADLYDIKRDFRRLDQALNIFVACFFAALVSVVALYSQLTYVGRGVFVIFNILAALILAFTRSKLTSLASSRALMRRALIVGAGSTGKGLAEAIHENTNNGIWVVGFIDDDPTKQAAEPGGSPVLGCSADLLNIAAANSIDTVVICVNGKKSDGLVKALIHCHYRHIDVVDMRSVYEAITGKVPMKDTGDEWLLNSAMSNSLFMYKNFKRLMDVFFSMLLLILASPVCLMSAALIKLTSKGGVLYRQERVGKDYGRFTIYKFRTMVHDADRLTGPRPATKDDPRVTMVGKYLRKLRVDELPQLFNVLKGDMSLVGPRPDISSVVEELDGDAPSYGYRLVVKPGITGWAQVMYPYASSKEEFMEKLHYDLYYIKNMSIILDLVILLKTIRTVLLFRGN